MRLAGGCGPSPRGRGRVAEPLRGVAAAASVDVVHGVFTPTGPARLHRRARLPPHDRAFPGTRRACRPRSTVSRVCKDIAEEVDALGAAGGLDEVELDYMFLDASTLPAPRDRCRRSIYL